MHTRLKSSCIAGVAGLAAIPLTVAVAHAKECKSSASFEKKIGSMIVVGFLGKSTKNDWFGEVAKQLENKKIAGVLYLGRNIVGRKSVQKMNLMLNAAAEPELAPILAIDQEGGLIQRLTPELGFKSTPSAQTVARKMKPRAARRVYNTLARSLADWGFTLNLGPVVDLNINARNPIIGKLGRSYSKNPSVVVQYATEFVKAHRAAGVMTALKHFPGHGSSKTDSHKQFVDVTSTWSRKELEPYATMIRRNNVDLIMIAHVRNGHMQPKSDKGPISLSPKALETQLRIKLGYRGVIISDDIQMKAVSQKYAFDDSIISSVLAGNDLLLFANDKKPQLRLPEKVIKILSSEACKNPQLKARIVASSLRVNRLRKTIAASAGVDPIKTRSIGKTKDNLMTPDRMAAMVRPELLIFSDVQ